MQEQDTHLPAYWRLRWLLLAVLAVLYGISLPHTVQNLDSGELVAAAWKLTVAHPPGYPLYVWLQHAFMKVVPWDSPFHRAALGNALCALGTVALLLRLSRSWVGVALVAVMSTTPLVWRYAVLPDVFGLHLLLVTALLAVACARRGPWTIWLAALIFGLGAANHPSIVFLLPVLLLVAWEEPSRARAAGALVAGALVTVALYASLLALDSASLDSWSTLEGAQDVIDHFLRKAYGTFRLSGHEVEVDALAIFAMFARSCGVFGAAALVLIIAGCALRRQALERWRVWWLMLVCLAGYIVVFFPRMNASAHALQDGVRERFFLLPIVLLAALAARVVLPRGRLARLAPVLAGALGIVLAVQVATADNYGYAGDTVVEDYARNLLTLAKSTGKPAFVIVESDTQLFALYYVAAVDGGFEDVVPLGLGNIFLVDRLQKIKKRWPSFVYDVDAIFGGERREIFRSFIGPNIDDFSVISTIPVTSPHWRTTFYPLGRRIETGSGIAIASAPVVINPPVYKADDEGYVETKDLYADYAVYHLARGRALLAGGERDKAQQAFRQGLEIVPYCIPCLKNFCLLDENHDERCGWLQSLEAHEYRYLD